MTKKKLLTIHNNNWSELASGDKASFNREVTGFVVCCTDYMNNTYIRNWMEVTPEECEGYEFVLMVLLPEQNLEKINKQMSIITKPGRTYKTIVYIADVTGWQMNPFLPENKIRYMDILTNCDYVFRYNLPESESYWKAVMRDKPSYFIERAYPVEMIKDILAGKDAYAEKILANSGINIDEPYIFMGKSLKNINEERNMVCTLYVARQIQKSTGWKVVCFANNPLDPKDKDRIYKESCGLENVTELPVCGWASYMKILNTLNINVGIYLDCLETRGQVALDCAGTGIPLVCSGSVAGYRLFPHTFVKHYREIDDATEKAVKLCDDSHFKNKVVSYAQKGLAFYSFAQTKERIDAVLGVKL